MTPSEAPIVKENEEDSEDKAALRALLAGVDGEYSGPRVDIIPTPVSEQDAYKQDVEELPEPSSLADYERIPVSQFGAAMLRGMGWKEGTAASRKGNGIVQPYIPESRPALLGIGAKEMETFDDGSKKNKSRRPEKRYIPVVKKDRDGNIISEGDSRPRRDVDKERRRERSEGDSRPKRDVDKERRRERSSSPRRESRVSSRRASPDTRSYDDRSKKDDRDRRDRENGRRDRDRERGDRRDRSRESEKRRR
ncbi:DExH-box splicing factor binding site-domain-containing protein [Rhodocollybia butyracea]|uniref:DExH-box splicing factor binding site-domain-containing protein n=1 Tax=Rhodocollybia butyracea TaxID=206335 RepID=A0A9P5PWS2_9AGAR|nr:DExH-box splicing factor binding site-domain-containing protein [Rhodocollybia butyracea]